MKIWSIHWTPRCCNQFHYCDLTQLLAKFVLSTNFLRSLAPSSAQYPLAYVEWFILFQSDLEMYKSQCVTLEHSSDISIQDCHSTSTLESFIDGHVLLRGSCNYDDYEQRHK